MNRYYFYIFILALSIMGITSCSDVLDLKPLNKIDGETLFATEEGVRVYMANLYAQAPIEDFNFCRIGFNTATANVFGGAQDTQTDNAVNSEFNDFPGSFVWWEDGYKLIRDINSLLKTIPGITALSESKKNEIISEAHFLRAYCYFALAKRYGGVPVIAEYQEYTSDIESLKIPRSTEKDTWEFVMTECDAAVEYLPSTRDSENKRRTTKWAALALKSRAALHAASIAKYGSNYSFSGEAVSAGLVGIPETEANHFYELCITASKKIMDESGHGLYKPTPASTNEAMQNYLALFQDPNIAPEEAIFIKGYTVKGNGHSWDFWYSPNQTRNGANHPGRMNPTLNLVDLYENYDNPGQSAPVVTTADGNINDYNGYRGDQNYLRFNTPYEIFEGKDVRLWATTVLPGTEWQGKTINIQAGYIQPDGTPIIEGEKASITIDGVTYHTFGADAWTDYSGFDGQHLADMTRTGFSFKKFLSPTVVTGHPNLGQSLNDWMDMRYAEVLLNYAEAVVESGSTGNSATATTALNAIRRRAGHTTDIPLTLDNVLRERRVELAFENKRWWDLVRRRDFHVVFNNVVQKALIPVLDLRVSPPKYIFVRKDIIRAVPWTFNGRNYYHSIPGIGSNGLIQNPQY